MRLVLLLVAVVACVALQGASAQRVRCSNNCGVARRPVCATVNGRLTTFRNRCLLNAKIRCARRRRRAGVQGVATYRFRYRGRCRRRTTTRRTTTRRTTTTAPPSPTSGTDAPTSADSPVDSPVYTTT